MKPRANARGRVTASGGRRALVPVAWLAALVLVVSVGAGPTALASPAHPGHRVTVAVFGDSVVESLLVPNFLRQGLVPQLARDVWSLGYAPGGIGLIPAATFRWHFSSLAKLGARTIPPNGWLSIGFGAFAGYDGPSGYSAVAVSPGATATTTVSDPDVEVLYTSTPVPCAFSVTAAGRSWTIDTFRSGPEIDTRTALQLPGGRHQLTIHGPNCGLLLFDGVVVQRPVAPGKVQVEVDDLGHTAGFPSAHFGPRIQEALTDQRYDISVFLYGFLAEDVGGLWSQYLSSMTARARIARAHGGACLIVEPAPINVPGSAVKKVASLDRTVARREGCTYTTVLAQIWGSAHSAERQGLLLGDFIHPSAAGYTLIARALAPVIAQLVQAHLHP